VGLYVPLVDGYVVPDDPVLLVGTNNQSKIPLLIGHNADEGLFSARDFTVADGKILGIAATPSVRTSVTIDGTGKTALPGLIDVHVHMLVGITEADTRRFIENALKEKAAGLPATRGDGGGVGYGAVSTSNTRVENSSRWSSDKASDSQATSLLPVMSTSSCLIPRCGPHDLYRRCHFAIITALLFR
jgi:hypothetical protein